MKLSWMEKFVLNSLAVIAVSGTLMFFLEEPGEVDTFLDYMYMFAMIAFLGGTLAIFMTGWEHFFQNCGAPNYIYRPKKRYIFVRYTSTSFLIERNGVQIRVGMVLDAQLRHRQITLQNTNPDFFVSKNYFTGREDDNLFFTTNGQKLHLSRKIFGIKVWWDEENDPWKIVEE